MLHKDSTGRFVKQVCQSLKEPGWHRQAHGNLFGVDRSTFKHENGVAIACWVDYFRTRIWFREPPISITEAEEKRVRAALARWVRQHRREAGNVLAEKHLT